MGTRETTFGRWTLSEWDDFPPQLSRDDVDVTVDRDDETLVISIQDSNRSTASIPLAAVQALIEADRINRLRTT